MISATRGALKKKLQLHLRSRRAIRRAKGSSFKRHGLGSITHAVLISDQAASAENRAAPRRWEGDLIGGSTNTYIATLVERHTG